jgi:hypothetical protein
MPDDILAAADEAALTQLLHDAELAFGTHSTSGSSSFGPFTVTYGASANFSGGAVTLSPPNVVHVNNLSLSYTLNFTFSIDLNNFLPHFCLPQVCIKIPFIGKVCTPKICVSWPTISVPVSYSDAVTFSSDFAIVVHSVGAQWWIDITILGFPNINLSVTAGAILSALGLVLGAVLLAIPFIGPFLAGVVALLLSTIGIAGVTGLLGPIVSIFVSGLTFNIYKQPKHFQVLPSSGMDPAVFMDIASLNALVESTDKNEFVIKADI